MKNQITFLKAGLVVLLLISSITSYSQIIAPIPTAPIDAPEKLNVGRINDDATGSSDVELTANTILFYDPSTQGPTLTLTASLTDGNTPAATFTSYSWIKITNSGGTESASDILSETTQKVTLSQLEPGYHKYRVYGRIEENGITCQSDEYQDIIFFVLRPLSLTAEVPTGALAEYCKNDVPSGKLSLNATAAFGTVEYNTNGYANPAIADFSLTYRWYAINSEAPTVEISLVGTGSEIEIDYADLADLGKYTFHAEVQYDNAIKDRGSRDHAFWTATVTNAAGDPYELQVTPAPGRPTITIEDVID